MNLYEIRYKFFDELHDRGQGWRVAYIVAYDSDDGDEGEKLEKALGGDMAEVNDMLDERFDLNDEDIAFYYDWGEREPEDGINSGVLVRGLQRNYDILIDDIKYID